MRQTVARVGLVIGLIPATIGFSDPTLSGEVLNTMMISSLLCVGPWVLQNVDLNTT